SLPQAAGEGILEPVDAAAQQMPAGMTGQAVEAEKDDVDQHDHRPEADKEMALVGKGALLVDAEEDDDDQTQEQEIPVVVIQHPGKAGLAAVPSPLQLLDRTRRGIPEKRSEV